ncbi:MAG: DUF3106 domain-containing protein [Planctomycetes bacterium]|nr:DUF3106 domain-containing protein [Planctomycetota bacterium]
MTPLAKQLTVLVLGWLAVFAVAAPEALRPSFLDEAGVLAQEGRSARERWEALTPGQRARLEQRFERLQRMEADERAALEQRAERLRSLERRVVDGLSERDRARLMALPPAQRRQLLGELVEAELRERGQRLEAKLPSEVREWLQQTPPQERRQRLEAFKGQVRERTSVAAVEQIARALGFGQAEIERLQRLPLDERMDKVLQLYRRLSQEQIERGGLPNGLSAARWKELDALPPREYLAEIMALRADGLLGDALRPARPVEGVELSQLARDLSREVAPDPEARLELAELAPDERKAELARRRRARVAGLIHERGLLTPAQEETLAAMPDGEFFRQVRRLARRVERGRPPSLPARAERD